MSQSYIDANGYTNLYGTQVYNAAEGLACGWKWSCQDPCCKNAPASPNANGRCSCCESCDLGEGENEPSDPQGGDNGSGWTSDPCCYNGTCCGCKSVAGADIPPLYPRPIGCGTRHICQVLKTLPLCAEQLDQGATDSSYADLPGRPPHSIVCVRATGASVVDLGECLGVSDMALLNPNCDSYNLWLRFKVPVEIIVRDCSGYLYCLKSFFTELVRIPLTARIHNLGSSMVYTKVRVRLCAPNKAEAIPLYTVDGDPIGKQGPTICASTCSDDPPPFFCVDSILSDAFNDEVDYKDEIIQCLFEEEGLKGCNFAYTLGTYGCHDRDSTEGPDLLDRCTNGNPKVDILIEACVVRLVTQAGGADDPLACLP